MWRSDAFLEKYFGLLKISEKFPKKASHIAQRLR